ncbi:MAG: universal stress protein [Caulobacterales bacterium]|nr:universal stress protein [Caulobacterales bacterium]
MTERAFKFLVIADGSPESRLAAYFAALRAKHTSGQVVLFAVIEPAEFHHWLGVSAEIERETRERVDLSLRTLAEEVLAETGEAPEFVVREGDLRAELRALIERDRDIRILVLGVAPGGNPGPLVQALVRGRNMFGDRSIPVAVLPAACTREEIADLA